MGRRESRARSEVFEERGGEVLREDGIVWDKFKGLHGVNQYQSVDEPNEGVAFRETTKCSVTLFSRFSNFVDEEHSHQDWACFPSE